MLMTPKEQISFEAAHLELSAKLERKQLEVNALLELTRAIQENYAESKLFQIYTFTFLGLDTAERFALFALDGSAWKCKLKHATAKDYFKVTLPDKFTSLKTMTEIADESYGFQEFNLVIPVSHKSSILAYLFLGGLQMDTSETLNRLAFINAFTNVLVVALENKRLVRQQIYQEAIKKELEIARSVQQNLFPAWLPSSDRMRVEAYYLPHQSVGGDFYEFIQLSEDKYLIAIADISGKGIPASLLMANFHASLNTLVRQSSDLVTIVNELNFLTGKSRKGDYFITAFIAIYDQQSQKLTYINAGHNPPVMITDVETSPQFLEKGCTILGMFDKLPAIEFGEIDTGRRFMLFAYTDGLSELRNPAGDEMGHEPLVKILAQLFEVQEKSIQPHIVQLIESHRDNHPYHDDITFISFKAFQD